MLKHFFIAINLSAITFTVMVMLNYESQNLIHVLCG
jgi:hypothetical protein